MTHKLGLDFGTTATKIAYLDAQDQLRLFHYPGTERRTIPSVLVYHAPDKRALPSVLEDSAHILKGQQENDRVCEYFKALLPLKGRKQWRAHGWSVDSSPEEATRAYLRQLLLTNPQSVTQKLGAIDTVVVAIPDAWHQEPKHQGTHFLQQLFQDFALPNVRFHSESACAVAYIAHCYQQLQHQPFAGTLLVCDMGGSGFRAAVCRVHAQQSEILAYEGDGGDGLGLGGVTFDRLATAAAYTAVHGSSLPADHSDFLITMRAFTAVKEREHDNLLALLTLQQHTPTLSDTPLYIIQDKYTLDTMQLQRSFQPIAEHIEAVLSRLLTRAARHQWVIDHAILIGGFSRSPFVQHAIMTQLKDQVPILQLETLLPDTAEPTAVVAYGAALLAHQPTYVPRPYPHTIGIFVHRRERGSIVETFVPFIEAKQHMTSSTGIYFLHDGEKGPLLIHVAQRGPASLPLYVRWRGVGELHAIAVPEVEYPGPGAYHVALVFDACGKASLLFDPVPAGEAKSYPLGSVHFDLLVEE